MPASRGRLHCGRAGAFSRMLLSSWFPVPGSEFAVGGGFSTLFFWKKTRVPITAPPRTGNGEQELGTRERFTAGINKTAGRTKTSSFVVGPRTIRSCLKRHLTHGRRSTDKPPKK